MGMIGDANFMIIFVTGDGIYISRYNFQQQSMPFVLNLFVIDSCQSTWKLDEAARNFFISIWWFCQFIYFWFQLISSVRTQFNYKKYWTKFIFSFSPRGHVTLFNQSEGRKWPKNLIFKCPYLLNEQRYLPEILDLSIWEHGSWLEFL